MAHERWTLGPLALLAACHAPAAPAAPVAAPAASATSPAAPPVTAAPPPGRAPCQPDQPFLDGPAVFRQFEQYAEIFGPVDDPLPAATFGTCRVHAGEIRDAGGQLVAGISCGLRIVVPGIRDNLGLTVGVRGREVLARLPADHGVFRCLSNGDHQVRCDPTRGEDEDTDPSWYVVEGALPPGQDLLTGAAAEAFFADRPLVEIHMSVWCH